MNYIDQLDTHWLVSRHFGLHRVLMATTGPNFVSPGVEGSIFTWPRTEYYSFFLGAILSRTLPATQICVMAPSRGWGFWKKKDVLQKRVKRFSEKSIILKTLNPYRVPSCSFEMLDICLTNNHHKRNYSKKGRVPNSTARLYREPLSTY